jgi:hypothetical protein
MKMIGALALGASLLAAPICALAQQDVTVLVGARKGAAPPPPPPATQKPTMPESYRQPVGPFFFHVETLTSANMSKYGVSATTPCVVSGVYKRGMRLVFRFEVLDVASGRRVIDGEGATVKVRLQHGEEVPARFVPRGAVAAVPGTAWMWDVSWDIPPDYPVGSLDYTIVVATRDGRTGVYEPPVQRTTTTDTRVRIID